MQQLFAAVVLLAALAGQEQAQAFYLPGIASTTYKQDQPLELKVNSLTSSKTQLSYDFYKLPFCQPDKIINAAENLGEILTGNKIENTAYQLALFKEETCRVLCRKQYNKEEVKKFVKKIEEDYTINMLLDNLPAATVVPLANTQSSVLAYDHGFHVGGTIRTHAQTKKDKPKYYLNNHIRITVRYHPVLDDLTSIDASQSEGVLDDESGDESALIVGLEIEAFSINHERGGKRYTEASVLCQSTLKHKFDDEYPQLIDPQSDKNSVVYTYDVAWEPSDVKWASRWDLYLNSANSNGSGGSTAEVHWFSIINSLLIVLFLSGMVAMILLRTLHKDLTRYNKVLTDEEKAEELEETGWKLVHGDVFRPPARPLLFSVTVGSGVQTFGMGIISLALSAVGFLSPANRGMLMMALLLLWVFMGVFAGYSAARQFKMFNGKEWQRATVLTAVFYPGIVFVVLFVLNLIVWGEGTTNAVPFTSMLAVLCLWFFISVPLTFLGAFFGFRRDVDKFPVQTQEIPRQIPAQPWYMSAPVTILVGGILPFGAVFVELFFILTTLWLDSFYYVYGFLVLVFIILVITCAEISVVLCYFQLCGEDYQWWWRSMFTSGSSALYVFLYSLHWYTLKLHSTRFVTHVLFFGYMSVLSLLFFLGTAFVGYTASFYFVWKIFASVKVD